MSEEAVLISMCSLGIACQYRPHSFKRKIVDEYKKKYSLIPVCPEQLGGLPTPRMACHLDGNKVIGRNNVDYTENFVRGSELTLKIAKTYGVKKAYLKKRSPSCGKNGVTRKLLEKNDIKVYQI